MKLQFQIRTFLLAVAIVALLLWLFVPPDESLVFSRQTIEYAEGNYFVLHAACKNNGNSNVWILKSGGLLAETKLFRVTSEKQESTNWVASQTHTPAEWSKLSPGEEFSIRITHTDDSNGDFAIPIEVRDWRGKSKVVNGYFSIRNSRVSKLKRAINDTNGGDFFEKE